MSLQGKQNFLSRQLKNRAGYKIDWKNPKMFNEKLAWLKLYHHDPLITVCADKYKVREFVKDKVGEKHLVPLLGVWERPEDINFDKLPDKFVLKVNWGWNQNIIVKNKADLDIETARKTLGEWLKPWNNNFWKKLEWSYKNIESRIIAEEYIEKLDTGLLCYKVFCFNGEPKFFQVVYDDKEEHSTVDYFDLNWKKLPFEQVYPNSSHPCESPKNLDKMLEIATVLSEPFPFVRVDLYEIDNEVLFSELTFFSHGGDAPFKPAKWDRLLGDMLTLPKEKLNDEVRESKMKEHIKKNHMEYFFGKKAILSYPPKWITIGITNRCNNNHVSKTKEQWKSSATKHLEQFRKSQIVAGINEGSVCIDCGANVGVITEVFAEQGAEVHAFEPNPVAFGELKKKFSSHPKITLYPQAVLDRNDKLKLFMYKFNEEDKVFWSQGASLYGSKDDIDKGDFVEVEVIDLIAFIENLNKPIDVLKLDVEGGEYDILLKLLEKDLHARIKHILVEIHDKHIPDIIPKGDRVRNLIKEKSIKNINLEWV